VRGWPGKGNVADILAGTGGEAPVFDPAHGLSDAELGHGYAPSIFAPQSQHGEIVVDYQHPTAREAAAV